MPNKIYLGPLLIVFLTVPAAADVIKLNSGQQIDGKILKQDKDSILVDAGIDTPVTYFRDEIKEIITAPAPVVQAAVSSPQTRLDADAKEAKAVELIDAGRMDEGLAQLQEALALDPTPQRHFNYGSILFGNGVAEFKKGAIDHAKKILLHAQDELDKAVKSFDHEADKLAVGQAYFLMGEMQAKAFADTTKAKTYYQQAVTVANHAAAKAALGNIN